MERNEPTLTTLSLSHGHDARSQIDVAAGQEARFGDTHASCGEEAKERDVGAGSQASARLQLGGNAEQIEDLSIGVDVRRFSPVAGSEQPNRWNLRRRVEQSAVPCETAGDVEAPHGR
jgi:hypothetical protein